MRDIEQMEQGLAKLLDGWLGVEWRTDQNFEGTPGRVARMYLEMTSPPANNWKTFPAHAADVVLMRGHRVFALCPHHLLPVELKAYVAYIPNKLTLGLSKLARVVEQHLTKPVLQEALAHAVANSIDEVLEPKGVGVILAGVHGCMRCRGVESDGDVVSSVMKGVFLLNPAARMELMQLIGRP